MFQITHSEKEVGGGGGPPPLLVHMAIKQGI